MTHPFEEESSMAERCEECADGTVGCGPDGVDVCGHWANPDEDRCHKVVVLVREKKKGKCTARLWVPGPRCKKKPKGYRRAGHFFVRVQAGKMQNKCAAKILNVEWLDPSTCSDIVDDEPRRDRDD